MPSCFDLTPSPPLLLMFSSFSPAGNLLVTKDCQLRITDFGLARAWDATAPNANDNDSSVGAMTE